MVEDAFRQSVTELLDFLEEKVEDTWEGDLDNQIKRLRKMMEEEMLIEVKWRTM